MAILEAISINPSEVELQSTHGTLLLYVKGSS